MLNKLKSLKKSLIFITIVVLVGCSNSLEYSNDSASYPAEDIAIEYQKDFDRSGNDMSSPEVAPTGSFNTTTNLAPTNRMVIYNANLSLEVNEYAKVETDIQEKVSALGGYTIESSVYFSGEERINGHLVVKVPQQSFHDFIHNVENMSVKILDRNVQGNDVTEEYIDLESRLKSKRVVEERLLQFMKDAEKTEDLLRISSDLARVQEEIDQVLGRMNFLKTNVDYATITIHMTEKLVSIVTIQDTESLNTWLKAKSLFVDSVNTVISFFSSVIIVLIGRSPIILPLITFMAIIAYYLRKKGKNNE